jgi:hypothetical protein
MHYLLMLFLAACAAPQHRELRDGPMPTRAPVFVAPGYTPAGAGLPGEYMPGPPEPAVERSPHKRVLPPTKEPGIWAADRPASPPTEPDGWRVDPVILGVLIPYPPRLMAEEHKEPMQRCGYMSQRAITSVATTAQLAALSLDERRCLAAKLYLFCMTRERRIVDGQKVKPLFFAKTNSRLMRYAELEAQRMERVACGGQVVSEAMERMHADAATAWNSLDWITE